MTLIYLALVVLVLAAAIAAGFALLVIQHLRGELGQYRQWAALEVAGAGDRADGQVARLLTEHRLEREAWEAERAQLVARCIDPSLTAALTPYDTGEAPETGVLTEDEEIVAGRKAAAALIDAELAARELA